MHSRLTPALFVLGIFFIFGGPKAHAGLKRCQANLVLKDSLKVAAVQFPLGERATGKELLAKISGYVSQAHDRHADVVVFPELITTELMDWQSNIDEPTQLRRIAETFSDKYIEA